MRSVSVPAETVESAATVIFTIVIFQAVGIHYSILRLVGSSSLAGLLDFVIRDRVFLFFDGGIVVAFDGKTSPVVVVLNLVGGCDEWDMYESGFELTTGSRNTHWVGW